ncbi:hypothetical protein CH270_18300 [Rhodococcus sp. 02-925g]|nr:hypothetical protein CH270_18300 [Rhodococcus sp. 02-925g]
MTARDADQLDRARAMLLRYDEPVAVVACDLEEDASAERVVAEHQKTFGSLNALFMAAGVGSAAPLDRYPMTRFDKQLAVNLRAPFALTTLVLPLLQSGARNQSVEVQGTIRAYPDAGQSRD